MRFPGPGDKGATRRFVRTRRPASPAPAVLTQVKAAPAEMERLAPLIDDGICTVAESRVTVTEKGRPLVRLVAAAFDAYLTAGEHRYSRAV